MDFLPLHLISDDDRLLVDLEAIELAKLSRSGFPVGSGIVVFPPDIKDYSKIPLELSREISKMKRNPQIVWNELVKGWCEGLRAQPVIFVEKVLSSGIAFYDKKNGEVVIKIEKGDIDSGQKANLSDLISRAEKKVLLTMAYHWIHDGKGFKIVRVTPVRHEKLRVNMKDRESGNLEKQLSAVKVLFKQGGNFVINPDADGIIFLPETKNSFDEGVSRLVESAIAVYPKPVLVKLINIEDSKLILFGRNKRQLLNISVLIPYQKSVNDYLEVKRQLLSSGIARKGSMKFWLEVETALNYLELEEFIKGGLDGIFMNLDKLCNYLSIQKGQEKPLYNFLERPLQITKGLNIPVIIQANDAISDSLYDFLITYGIWGIVQEDSQSA